MIKLMSCLTLLLLFSFKAQTQTEYHHGLGGHLLSALDSIGGGGYGATYAARLNIVEIGDNSTVALSAYPGVGLSGSVNSRSGGSISFSYEIPVLATFNMGKYASSKADGGGGFFVGAGYHLYGFGDSDIGTRKGSGIMGMIGGRFQIGNYPLELNVSYSTGQNVVGGRIIYLFEGHSSSSASRSRPRRR